jgi:zinc ribbon protein
MTGLMQRILRRREPLSDESQTEAPAPEAEAQDPVEVPAGTDPDEQVAPDHPSFHHRGRMRRRLRYLRRARELGFRDLGGLVFDLRRFDRDRSDLVDAKVAALFEVDRELRALQTALGDRRDIHELREAGVASCPRCGALHGSEARFCPSCGTPLRGPQPVAEVGEALPARLSPAAPSPALGPGGTAAPDASPPQAPIPARRGQRADEPAPFDPEAAPADQDTTVLGPAGEADPPTRAMDAQTTSPDEPDPDPDPDGGEQGGTRRRPAGGR